MSTRVPVTFEPSGLTAWVVPGQTVLAAGRAAGVNISAPCGGRGVCGACGVRIIDGALAPPTAEELAALKLAPPGIRLACRALVANAVTLRPVVVNSTVSREIADLEGDGPLVVGVDLGTTSVSAAVLDASTGRQLGGATVLNRQGAYGADVLTRITAALEGQAATLRRLGEESVLDAIDTAAPGARARITRVVIAGNVVMASLLTGANVVSLSAHPFSVPEGIEELEHDCDLAAQLRQASVEIVPAAGGFVGGDVVAGLVALGLAESKGRHLLVDIGTNAEVALVAKGRVWVSSAAAGPAFEGGGISCGGPAAPESVVSVTIEGAGGVALKTLGDAPPTWFSGAGLVSAVAALRRAGHIDADGRMVAAGPLTSRFNTDEAGVLGVALGEPSGCLSVTQLDIRALQIAKAAVRVAVATVLSRAKTPAQRLDAFYVSGAFGAALATEDVVALGIVPAEAAAAVVHAGNTSLRGATAIAMDPSALAVAHDLANRVEVVDLAADPRFAAELMRAVVLEPYSE